MIGLSSIFVEPLEASSIGTTIQQMFMVLPSLFVYERGDTLTADKYNKDISTISENIVDFIQLHYFTQRSDTEFWRWCRNEIKLTDFNATYLEYFKKNFVHSHMFNAPMLLFSQLNYIQVMHGLRLFDQERLKEKYDAHMSKRYDPIVNQLLFDDIEYTKRVPSWPHREALEIIKERYDSISVKL